MKCIVTVTPPTPNGDLHLGHLAGPFLAADVYARLMKQHGHEVLLLSYSDDYQSYVLRQSRRLRESAQEIVRRNAAAMIDSLRMTNIHFDHFMQALGNQYFMQETDRHLRLVADTDGLARRESTIPHCASCDVEGYEGFGRGMCNHCGSPSDASQCEACARVPDLAAMGEMKCVLCERPMIPRAVSRHSWRIGMRYPEVRKRRQSSERASLRAYLDEVLSHEQDEWALTRPGEPAIPTGVMGGLEVHTWFAGLAGYRATLREYLDERGQGAALQSWWSPETELVHFLGLDCAYSHAVAYAALLSLEPSAPRYAHYVTNRFLKLDGADFSTSRNHAIWIRDVAREYPSDAVRFYTAMHAPEDATADFSSSAFREWAESFYQARLENGAWRSLRPAVNSAGEQQPLAELHQHLQEWRDAHAIGRFSIARLAQAQLHLAAVAERAQRWQGHAWLVFSHCGEALHPDLSRSIRAAVSLSSPAAAEWFRMQMHE